MFKRKWPCVLFGHRIELIWSNDREGLYTAMCLRCGETHEGESFHGKTEVSNPQRVA